MKFPLTITIIFSLFLTSCSQLPKIKLSQASLEKVKYEVYDDSLKIKFNNPLKCPLTISAKSPNKVIQEKLANNFPVTIEANKDMLVTYWTNKSKDEISIKFSATLGDPNDSIYKKDINLPFKKGNKYKIIQGYNGGYSHTSEYSKYALDFNLTEGDTVCVAADGFVVGVIRGLYRRWKIKEMERLCKLYYRFPSGNEFIYSIRPPHAQREFS